MRVHGSHPQVRKVDIFKNVYVFDCPDCGGEFYIRGAWVQPDGTLRCRKCSERDSSYRWCPRCHQAKPFKEFESDRHDAGRHQRCLECVEAQQEQESLTRACDRCGTEFTPTRRDARYCSGRCRVAAHRVALSRNHLRPLRFGSLADRLEGV